MAIFKFIVSIYLLSLSFSFSVPVLAETQCDWLAEDCRQHQPLSLESVQATIGITLNTYSHVLPNMQEEAANKIDELFNIEES